MIAVLVVHGVIGAALFPTGARLGRRSFLIAAVAPLATLIWLFTRLPAVLDGGVDTQHIEWVGELGLAIDLRLDGFAALMVLIVSGIGLAVFAYSRAYWSSTSEAIGRYAGLIVLFAGAMLCVVLADNLLLLYTGWELTSVTSYLLIGNKHTEARARAAALHALLVTSAGGLVMLAGFVFIGQAAGTFRMSEIVAQPPTGLTVSTGVALVLIGAFTKSAQYPFHSWLPGAMAAPTPVSAYLHSATMVKAGVYLVARLAPAFAAAGVWRPMVLTVGVLTMLFGGLRALRQNDLKLLLAHGTVSQLGFLMVLFGVGSSEATLAGCVMLLAHAVFKAALFMSVGTIDRKVGTRDLLLIPRLGREWRLFKIATIGCAASMAGIPLFFGFVAKEAGLDALRHGPFDAAWLVLVGVVAGSALTVGYSARFVWGMFGPMAGRANYLAGEVATSPVGPVDRGMSFPIAALAMASVALGVLPGLVDRVMTASSRALTPTVGPAHLAIWHGWNLSVGLSAVAIAGGGLLFIGRRRVSAFTAIGARVPSGTTVYTAMLRGTNTFSTRLTAVVQNGSLPVYAGVTLLTAAVVPGLVLVTQSAWPRWSQIVWSWAQLPVVVVLLGAAVAAAVVRRRFSAALFLGTAGYAMAGLFVVQGAPDLALTQVAIETLSTVLFVLVLRRLPDRFERTSTSRRRIGRLALSVIVGVTVFAFAMMSRNVRTAEPVSVEMTERSLSEGHGRNVVNVILVDIRGLDTLGEITVLASAGIGAVALARAGSGRRRRRAVVDQA